tara:strand:- start:310 stop:543 length:234 start_codon:yes stop_codon:yes gene_type:complete
MIMEIVKNLFCVIVLGVYYVSICNNIHNLIFNKERLERIEYEVQPEMIPISMQEIKLLSNKHRYSKIKNKNNYMRGK